MPLWIPKRNRNELVDELGAELVEWGENVARAFDELPADDGSAKPDDLIHYRASPAGIGPDKPPTVAVEYEHRTESGALMACIICQARKTIDGRYCRRHGEWGIPS